MAELNYPYKVLYDIKTEEDLEREVTYLVTRLAGLAKLRREDGKQIDDYIMRVLDFPVTNKTVRVVNENVKLRNEFVRRTKMYEPEIEEIWYMRENHTFTRIGLDVEEAINKLLRCFVEGHTYGSVFSTTFRTLEPVHASGVENWDKFESAVREFYKCVKEDSNG